MPSFTLSWSDLSRNELGQRLYKSLSPFDQDSLPTPTELGTDIQSYTDTDIIVGVPYYYMISSYDGAEERFSDLFVLPAADVNFNLVSLRVPFDGTEGSTSFPDISGTGATLSIASGSPTITALFPAFTAPHNPGSLLLGANDIISMGVPSDCGMDLGTDDFTIEFWAQVPFDGNLPNNGTLALLGNIASGDAGSLSFVAIRYDGGDPRHVPAFRFRSSTNVVVELVSSISDPLTKGRYAHVALSRDEGILRLFVNGVLSAKRETNVAGLPFGGTGNFMLDSTATTLYKDLRVTKGVARYTDDSGFSPVSAPFAKQKLSVALALSGDAGPGQELISFDPPVIGDFRILVSGDAQYV